MKKKSCLIAMSMALAIITIAFSACSSSNKSSTASPSPSAPTSATVTESAYTGYLIDQSCGTTSSGKDMDGNDLIKNPEKHTVACDKMPDCVKSGYGISIKQGDGNYKYFKFDSTGSNLAKSEVIDKTNKKDSLSVSVQGVISSDTIKISSIKEN